MFVPLPPPKKTNALSSFTFSAAACSARSRSQASAPRSVTSMTLPTCASFCRASSIKGPRSGCCCCWPSASKCSPNTPLSANRNEATAGSSLCFLSASLGSCPSSSRARRTRGLSSALVDDDRCKGIGMIGQVSHYLPLDRPDAPLTLPKLRRGLDPCLQVRRHPRCVPKCVGGGQRKVTSTLSVLS
jgi:hypothetical protein